MKRVLFYSVCYLITIYFLVKAVLMPSADGAHVAFYFALSAFITFFNSTSIMKSTLLLVIAPWYTLFSKGKQKQAQHVIPPMFSLPQAQDDPLVSVIIPCFNEEKGIATTIKSVLASTYSRLEIVIINDGSTDNSGVVIRQFIQKYEVSMSGLPNRVPIVYYVQPNSGRKGIPVNAGIRLSHGEIIVIIDSDTYVQEKSIWQLVQTFQDKKIMGIGGNIRAGNRDSILADLQAIDYCFGYYSRRADTLLGTFHIISGALGAFRREVFRKIGYYATDTVTEDIEMTMRMMRAGMKVVYQERATAYTEVPTTLTALFKQRLRWGRGHAEAFSKHRELFFSTKREHNKLFSWVFMPLIAFHEWTCLISVALKILLYSYCIVFGANELLAFVIVVNAIMVSIALLNDKTCRKLALLAPIIWIIYLPLLLLTTTSTAIATWQVWHGREAGAWQKWEREGILTSKK